MYRAFLTKQLAVFQILVSVCNYKYLLLKIPLHAWIIEIISISSKKLEQENQKIINVYKNLTTTLIGCGCQGKGRLVSIFLL